MVTGGDGNTVLCRGTQGRLAVELLAALLRFWRHLTALGTCRPADTWKLPHQTWGHTESGGTHTDPSPPHSPPSDPPPYHEGRQHRLRKARLEGVQQLFGARVVEGQKPCGDTAGGAWVGGTWGMCGAHGGGGVGHTWYVWGTWRDICGAHMVYVGHMRGRCGARMVCVGHMAAHTEQTYGHTWATKGGTRSTRSSTCGAHIWGTHVGHTYGAHAEHFGAHVRHTEVCVQHT